VGRRYSAGSTTQIVRQGNDLALIDLTTGRQHRLTQDGSADSPYGAIGQTGSQPLKAKLSNTSNLAYGHWSPDSRFFLTWQLHHRGRPFPLVIGSAPNADGHRLPEAHIFRVAYPGDEGVPTVSLVIVDRIARSVWRLEVPELLLPYGRPHGVLWTEDGDHDFISEESRDSRTVTYHRISPMTGESRPVVVDDGELPLRYYLRGQAYLRSQTFAPTADTSELIVVSERDGRAHLYVFETASGELLRQLTKGDWSVVDLVAVDSDRRTVFFSAVARERDRDPYLSHFYNISLDGGPPVLLTPEHADHEVTMAPDRQHFVDVHSTVDRAPIVVLRNKAGELISELWRADPQPLLRLGWRPPNRFSVTAADGETTLWGTFFEAAGQGKAGCTPLLDAIYGGPQVTEAPTRWPGHVSDVLAVTHLGLAVFVLDARGTPLLPRAARDATWGEAFGSGVVAEDHAAAVRQLAASHKGFNPDLVGVYGHSWGGYFTVRLMGQRPELFKVGVAGAGSHDPCFFFSTVSLMIACLACHLSLQTHIGRNQILTSQTVFRESSCSSTATPTMTCTRSIQSLWPERSPERTEGSTCSFCPISTTG